MNFTVVALQSAALDAFDRMEAIAARNAMDTTAFGEFDFVFSLGRTIEDGALSASEELWIAYEYNNYYRGTRRSASRCDITVCDNRTAVKNGRISGIIEYGMIELKMTGLKERRKRDFSSSSLRRGQRVDFEKLKMQTVDKDRPESPHERAWIWLHQMEDYAQEAAAVATQLGSTSGWTSPRVIADVLPILTQTNSTKIGITSLLRTIDAEAREALLSFRAPLQSKNPERRGRQYQAMIVTCIVVP